MLSDERRCHCYGNTSYEVYAQCTYCLNNVLMDSISNKWLLFKMIYKIYNSTEFDEMNSWKNGWQ